MLLSSEASAVQCTSSTARLVHFLNPVQLHILPCHATPGAADEATFEEAQLANTQLRPVA